MPLVATYNSSVLLVGSIVMLRSFESCSDPAWNHSNNRQADSIGFSDDLGFNLGLEVVEPLKIFRDFPRIYQIGKNRLGYWKINTDRYHWNGRNRIEACYSLIEYCK